ncbi:hypothetical protein [Kibdelosporangium phytohabitans]|uniref:Uncharacterized protein n=1 Tax=Kibdelosporangium phytohabitans TaxID=860235 RepID=A0A0N9IEY4_9PSEU|nr:hypothetical protein [Kibdelosporangium phytohabitans]ALG13776.1 hypothetical protein AOZ06_49120 [Kibdelosporangium phytohabitans]MBE1467307.1 hypothetical protein [Kibdelosporangium phytohabitans]
MPERLEVPALLKLAIAVAVVGAVSLAIGPFVGVLRSAPPAAYDSRPLLVVLAVLPVLVAVGLLVARRPVGAAGVLVGAAFLAPGRALIDLQLASDALVASRPELVVPTDLVPLVAGTGTWLLVAGHVLTLAAGAMVIVRAGARPGTAVAAEFEESEPESRKRLLGWGLAFGGLAAIGLLMPPFRSDNAFLLDVDLANGPGLVIAGGLLIALAALLGCVVAGTSRTSKMGRGVLVGVAIAVLTFLLPAQIAGITVDWLHADWRSYMATVGALGLVATAVWPSGLALKRGEGVPIEQSGGRMHLIAGVFAILAGVAAILGQATDLFVVEIPTDVPINQTDELIILSGVRPGSFANGLLLPAGILVLVLGILLVIKPVARIFRPMLSVAWVGIPLAAFVALDAVMTATSTSGAIRAGAATWWTLVAVLLALVAAICAGAAGAIERDDVDLSDRSSNMILMAPLAAAALFAIGAFGLPAMRAEQYVAPGIWSNFRTASWGLVIALIAVVMAAAIASTSRPPRAAALLFGSAGLVAVHALEVPMTGGRAEGSAAAAGTWLSLATIAALVISAFVALAVRPEPARRR